MLSYGQVDWNIIIINLLKQLWEQEMISSWGQIDAVFLMLYVTSYNELDTSKCY